MPWTTAFITILLLILPLLAAVVLVSTVINALETAYACIATNIDPITVNITIITFFFQHGHVIFVHHEIAAQQHKHATHDRQNLACNADTQLGADRGRCTDVPGRRRWKSIPG